MSARLESTDILAEKIAHSWASRWEDCSGAYASADQLLATVEKRENPLLTANCLRTLAWCARWKGDFLQARTYARRAVNMLSRVDAPDVLGGVLSVLAQVEFCLGDPARAIACSERGLAAVADLAGAETHIDLYSTQAALYRYQSQTDKARECLEHALSIAQGRYPHDEIRVLCNIARLHAQLGDLAKARETAEFALQQVPDSATYLLLGYLHEVLGTVCLMQGDIDIAREHIETGLQLALDRSDRRLECEIRGAVASYHAAAGDLTRALDVARSGLRVAEQLKFKLWEIMYLEQISGFHEILGQYSKALTVFKKFHEQKKSVFNSDSDVRQQQLRATLESEITRRETALVEEKNRLLAIESEKRRKIRRELSYVSSRDTLTGLLNRQEFDRKLAALVDGPMDGKKQHVLFYIDMDQFKIINDTCGHNAGDRMIQEISVLIRKRLRSSDTLARLGGDEFGLLLHGCSFDSAVEVADALREAIADYRFVVDDQQLSVTACIGIVAIDENIGDAEQIMKYADAACYIAKENGRNQVQLHVPNSQELSERMDQMQWVVRINEALDNNEFKLYCQPINWLNDHPPSCSHIEVLLRLGKKNGELAYPRDFLPAAERYDLMPKVDRWVLAHSVDWLIEHRAQFGEMKMAINLSGETLSDTAFFDYAREQVTRFAANDVPIIFEITETSAIRNFHQLQDFIEQMRTLGIKFSLDDFGSGLSSFSYLKMLSVDYLKIDGSFVRDMLNDKRDYAIVNSINHIGQSLGLSTVAEYVESEDIVLALQEIGVDYGQGYSLGPPSPLADFLAANALPAVSGGN